MAEKGADEMYCRSCGEVIKKQAEVCPECGVRNEESTASTSQSKSGPPKSVGHDPSNYETTVSGSWWYGVAVGALLWVGLIIISTTEPTGTLEIVLGLLVLLAWAIMPVAAYYDMQYIRANSQWNPNTVLWVIATAVWLVNIVAGAIYLYRRHEVLNTP